jgi:hypothetical protein
MVGSVAHAATATSIHKPIQGLANFAIALMAYCPWAALSKIATNTAHQRHVTTTDAVLRSVRSEWGEK